MLLNFLKILFCKIFSFFQNDFVTNKIKPFNQIPGPKGPFNIGTILYYTSFYRYYSWDHLHESGFKKYKKYGSIVSERILPGVNVVWIFDPEDIKIALSDKSGHYPQRRSHLALQKYRNDRPEIYRSAGLLPTNGEEWHRSRSLLQKTLSSPFHVRNHLPAADKVIVKFVNYIGDKCEFLDFLPELERLNLELTCLMAFGYEIDSFSESERNPNSRSSNLMKSAETINDLILPTDQDIPFWLIFETPNYKKLRLAHEYLERIAIDLINIRKDQYKEECTSEEELKSLFDIYLNNPELNIKDITSMACDFLLAGVHTTSYTMSFLLYNIATNKVIQDRLFCEAVKNLPNLNDPINSNVLTEIPFTRAVLKESLRLNPISIGVGRITTRDLVLNGYHIPEGTNVVTQNLVACRLNKHFQNANEFIPDRWIAGSVHEVGTGVNPYLILPFGHGSRSCIARRLAEQNILIFLVNLFRNFELEWLGGETFNFETKLINKPVDQLSIRFHKRT